MPKRSDMPIVRAELEKIRAAHGGRLTPADVVKAAKNPRSPLHKFFEWDVQKAAIQHWLDQARNLIVFVTVQITDHSQRYNVVSYTKDPRTPNQPGYLDISNPADLDRDLSERIVLQELDRCASAIERARGVAALLSSRHPGLDQQLEDLLQQLAGIQQQLQAA